MTREKVSSLFELGWRQGSLLQAELPTGGLSLDEQGRVHHVGGTHDNWVVASQDCDLNSCDPTMEEPLVELRQVMVLTDAANWGIRSHRLCLSETTYTSSEVPAAFISPVALVSLTSAAPPLEIGDQRKSAFKTWLGYRYDRPAVPTHLVPLAQDIAHRAKRRSGRAFATNLHEVLVQFDNTSDPPLFALFAVMCDGTDPSESREWLANVGRSVPPSLGVLSDVEVGYRFETPLSLIEESYAADVSQLSWGTSPS